MKANSARLLRRIRPLLLTISCALFTAAFLGLERPDLPRWISSGPFFAIDPLVALLSHRVLFYSLIALIPLALTLIFGRFFCGWICPFGAVHQFVSWAASRNLKRASITSRQRFRIKYLVLLAILLSALAGTSLVGWLDPFSLLTRSFASAIAPAADHALHSLAGAAAPRRTSAQPVLIGVVFLILVGMNLWKRRFFCSTLCPLGALYGVAARFSLLRIAAGPACKHCGVCSVRCSFQGGADKGYLKSECDLCLACIEDCSSGCVQFELSNPFAPTAPSLNFERRELLVAAAAGVALAALPKIAVQAAHGTKAGHAFMRPPGSLAEVSFLSKCIRCGQCIASCPTSFIQPAFFEAGFEGIWTPVLNAQAGYCIYDCMLCTKVCPTGAIQPLTLVQKQPLKLGTAAIDTSRCLTSVDGASCTICADKCPVPAKPLRFRETADAHSGASAALTRRLYVVPDLCTGCGACEHFCPKGAIPAITVSSEDEDREALQLV